MGRNSSWYRPNMPSTEVLLLLFLASALTVHCQPSWTVSSIEVDDAAQGAVDAPSEDIVKIRNARGILDSFKNAGEWAVGQVNKAASVVIGGGIGALGEIIPNPIKNVKHIVELFQLSPEEIAKTAQFIANGEWKCGTNPGVEFFSKTAVTVACPFQVEDINTCCAAHDGCYTHQRKATNASKAGRDLCDDAMASCLREANKAMCSNLVESFITAVRQFGWEPYANA